MPNLPVNAHISEIDGAYYPVHLEWVPRIGELIDLYSYTEAAINRPAKRYYEVINIVHQLHDIDDKTSQPHNGHHFVTVFVKPSENVLFT